VLLKRRSCGEVIVSYANWAMAAAVFVAMMCSMVRWLGYAGLISAARNCLRVSDRSTAKVLLDTSCVALRGSSSDH
jgi:hypothetical protein